MTGVQTCALPIWDVARKTRDTEILCGRASGLWAFYGNVVILSQAVIILRDLRTPSVPLIRIFITGVKTFCLCPE